MHGTRVLTNVFIAPTNEVAQNSCPSVLFDQIVELLGGIRQRDLRSGPVIALLTGLTITRMNNHFFQCFPLRFIFLFHYYEIRQKTPTMLNLIVDCYQEAVV